MKICSLKSGIDLAFLDGRFESAKEGITGIDDGQLAENIIDNDFFISDLALLKSQTLQLLGKNQHHILNRVLKGGILLCFASKINEAYSYTNYTWIHNFTQWYNFEDLTGNDFKFCGKESFIEQLNKVNFKFECIFVNKNIGTNIFKEIAKNKAGYGIACFSQYGQGYIFILPRPENKDIFIDYFINNILPTLNINFEIESGSKKSIPEEIKKLSIFGQEKVQEKIDLKEEELKKKIAKN